MQLVRDIVTLFEPCFKTHLFQKALTFVLDSQYLCEPSNDEKENSSYYQILEGLYFLKIVPNFCRLGSYLENKSL